MTGALRRHDAGFTLVEMLIALALIALLSALLVGGLRLSHAAISRGEAANERTERVALAFAVIRREVARADPLLVAPLTSEPEIAFSGTADGMTFIAPPAAYLALGGEQITWIAIEHAPGGVRIVLRSRPFDRAADLWPPAPEGATQSTVLLDGLAGAAFAYLGEASPDAAPQWLAAWPDAVALPLLMRLRVAGGWPDLLIEPRLGKTTATGFLGSASVCPRGLPTPFCL